MRRKRSPGTSTFQYDPHIPLTTPHPPPLNSAIPPLLSSSHPPTPPVTDGVNNRELNATKYQLTQDVFDALIPAGTLGYLPFMDEGLIGLAGVVSSLLGGYTQWIKTK